MPNYLFLQRAFYVIYRLHYGYVVMLMPQGQVVGCSDFHEAYVFLFISLRRICSRGRTDTFSFRLQNDFIFAVSVGFQLHMVLGFLPRLLSISCLAVLYMDTKDHRRFCSLFHGCPVICQRQDFVYHSFLWSTGTQRAGPVRAISTPILIDLSYNQPIIIPQTSVTVDYDNVTPSYHFWFCFIQNYSRENFFSISLRIV